MRLVGRGVRRWLREMEVPYIGMWRMVEYHRVSEA